VLVGAAFGAILGPVAFTPLLAGRSHSINTLSVPWIPAAVAMLVGAALTIAREARSRPGPPASQADVERGYGLMFWFT
jgi:hypothetical protein